MRGFRDSLRDDPANGFLHALFVIHIEGRRQSPEVLKNHFDVLGSAEACVVTGTQSAEEDHRPARFLKVHRRGAARFHQTYYAHYRSWKDRLAERLIV